MKQECFHLPNLWNFPKTKVIQLDQDPVAITFYNPLLSMNEHRITRLVFNLITIIFNLCDKCH